MYYFASNVDAVRMIVRDKYNNLKTGRLLENINPINNRYANIGDINEPLIAGDSIYFLSTNTAAGQRILHAIVTMTAI